MVSLTIRTKSGKEYCSDAFGITVKYTNSNGVPRIGVVSSASSIRKGVAILNTEAAFGNDFYEDVIFNSRKTLYVLYSSIDDTVVYLSGDSIESIKMK